jgi:hypothetical protein
MVVDTRNESGLLNHLWRWVILAGAQIQQSIFQHSVIGQSERCTAMLLNMRLSNIPLVGEYAQRMLIKMCNNSASSVSGQSLGCYG